MAAADRVVVDGLRHAADLLRAPLVRVVGARADVIELAAISAMRGAPRQLPHADVTWHRATGATDTWTLAAAAEQAVEAVFPARVNFQGFWSCRNFVVLFVHRWASALPSRPPHQI